MSRLSKDLKCFVAAWPLLWSATHSLVPCELKCIVLVQVFRLHTSG